MLTVLDKKKRGYGQKNKLEEIEKPRGFDRNLPIERILGATDCKGDLMFLLKWVGCDEYDLLPVSEINEKDPATVIAYYEERSPIVRKCMEKAAIQADIDSLYLDGPKEQEEQVAVVEEKSAENVAEIAGELPTAEEESVPNVPEAETEETGDVPMLTEETGPVEDLETVEDAPPTEAMSEEV